METNIEKTLSDLIPVWDKMEEKHKQIILNNIEYKRFNKNDVVHDNDVSCLDVYKRQK